MKHKNVVRNFNVKRLSIFIVAALVLSAAGARRARAQIAMEAADAEGSVAPMTSGMMGDLQTLAEEAPHLDYSLRQQSNFDKKTDFDTTQSNLSTICRELVPKSALQGQIMGRLKLAQNEEFVKNLHAAAKSIRRARNGDAQALRQINDVLNGVTAAYAEHGSELRKAADDAADARLKDLLSGKMKKKSQLFKASDELWAFWRVSDKVLTLAEASDDSPITLNLDLKRLRKGMGHARVTAMHYLNLYEISLSNEQQSTGVSELNGPVGGRSVVSANAGPRYFGATLSAFQGRTDHQAFVLTKVPSPGDAIQARLPGESRGPAIWIPASAGMTNIAEETSGLGQGAVVTMTQGPGGRPTSGPRPGQPRAVAPKPGQPKPAPGQQKPGTKPGQAKPGVAKTAQPKAAQQQQSTKEVIQVSPISLGFKIGLLILSVALLLLSFMSPGWSGPFLSLGVPAWKVSLAASILPTAILALFPRSVITTSGLLRNLIFMPLAVAAFWTIVFYPIPFIFSAGLMGWILFAAKVVVGNVIALILASYSGFGVQAWDRSRRELEEMKRK